MSFFPPEIQKLPSIDLSLEGMKSHLVQSIDCQIVFFEFDKDHDLPEHHHAAQYGVVLRGKIDLTIDGVKNTFTKGDTYYIPEGVKHNAKIYAGYADMTFFGEKDRYKSKGK